MNSELAKLRQENEELKAQLAADPYTKIEELGSGGFCTTWRATRRVDDQHFIEVCLKELKPKLRDDPDSARYFRCEARIASNLRHSKIVLLIDVDFARHRLVYELVDGVDLQRLRKHAGGRLSPELVSLVGLEIASALDYAHSRTREDAPAGVIHRDLTPANVLISVDGQIMLADFGVAAIESAERQTSVRGTVGYMSPEQARGWPVDAGTDLFALGVVLYELITGRLPFDGDGDSPASFERLGRGEYPSIESIAPNTPAALIAVITRLLHTERADRYASAGDVFSALSAIAPSHDVVRSLGALARAARKRKTKDYQTLRLPHGIQSAALHQPWTSARVPQVHNATTAVRADPDYDGTLTVPSSFSRKVRQRTVAGAVGVALFAVMFFVWPMSRSSGGEAARARAAIAASPSPSPTVSPPMLAGPGATDPSGAEGTPVAWVQSNESPASAAGDSSSPASPAAAVPEPVVQAATIIVNADKNAPVVIDGHKAHSTPLTVSVQPGEHTIVVDVGERQKLIKTRVSAGDKKEFFVKLRHPQPSF